jgi:hypothetical protein
MAILYGTTGDGTTLPVLVDQFGNLLAKGIDGEPGTPGTPGIPGEPGPPGADGGDFPLPPDPYEGAFLGWLNNELAWIGTPPVPIPDGVFGPITSWDPGGVLGVEGEIPPEIKSGVYVYQCNQDGTIFVDGWNTTELWSNGLTSTNGFQEPIVNGFDGSINTVVNTVADSSNQSIEVTFDPPITGTFIEWYSDGGGSTYQVNGGTAVGFNPAVKWITASLGTPTAISKFTLNKYETGAGGTVGFYALKIDGALLVNKGEYPAAPNLNFRVQSVNGQTLIGAANRTDDFTIGKYLRVPEQNVARWLYDGNLSKVITSTGIDISRLTGN